MLLRKTEEDALSVYTKTEQQRFNHDLIMLMGIINRLRSDSQQ